MENIVFVGNRTDNKFVAGETCNIFGVPLYVDNVGSVLTGVLDGPIPGVGVGFLSNAVNSIQNPITMYYGILTIV